MLNKDDMVNVKNRSICTVGYKVPDLGVRRQFMPNEVKEVSMDELRKLSYLPGGLDILKNYLIIENQEAVNELLGHIEPEYNYTDADIKELLTHGTLDQLLDCLDFAPQGVIETIKDMAVKMELNDMQKREAILEKTHFNVTNAIRHNKESAEGAETAVEEHSTRRAAPITETASATEREPQRRSELPKYKVVSMEES